MLWNIKEGKILIDNIPTDHISFGSGKKNLIMIQGLNSNGIKGSGMALAFMYRIFMKEYTVHIFERRTVVTREITVRDMADDVAKAMDVLHIKNADVFGVSQGGMIAQYLAIDRPDLVHKLVLAVTLSRNNKMVMDVIDHWIDLTVRGNMKALISDIAMKMYSERYMKRYKPFIPILTLLEKPKNAERFICLAKACLTCNAYDELEKIQCPVFIIGGKLDAVVSEEASIEMADRLNCQIYMYDDLGHAAYEEAKDFNKKVLEFFRS